MIFQINFLAGHVVDELMKEYPPSRRDKLTRVYEAPKSFTKLEDLDPLFGYEGVPWHTKTHQGTNVTSFVPRDWQSNCLRIMYQGKSRVRHVLTL